MRLRIDLYQLCQRILQSSGNGCRASLSYIKIRELLRCQLAGGINGSSCLVYDHILNLLRNFFEQLHDNLLRFSGSSSISQGDQRNMIFLESAFSTTFLDCLDLVRVVGAVG